MKFICSTSFRKFSISLSINNLWYLSICMINLKYSCHAKTINDIMKIETNIYLSIVVWFIVLFLCRNVFLKSKCFDKNEFNLIYCKDNSAFYPPVQQPNQQQLQQPQQQQLIQANEGQCQPLSNGQTQINFIAEILQLMIILLTQLLII